MRNQQARYDVGLATTKDLIDFQDRLTQAERAEVDALTGYNIELAHLRRADGHAAARPQHRARAHRARAAALVGALLMPCAGYPHDGAAIGIAPRFSSIRAARWPVQGWTPPPSSLPSL